MFLNTFYPGLLTSGLFWGSLVAMFVVYFIRSRDGSWFGKVASITMLTGVSLNAAVAMANGGFLPQAILRAKLAVPITASTHLRWLAWGMVVKGQCLSIGDLLLVGGFIVPILGTFITAFVKAFYKHWRSYYA
jgi:hypothetical protein